MPKLEFSYGTVERAVAWSHAIPETARKAGFRSMLNNLQKLGVLGEAARVGRGTPLTYTPTELHRLVLGVELCELGLPPATAVGLVATYWDSKFKKICDDAESNNPAARGDQPIDPGDDTVIYLGGVALRTGSLKGSRSPTIPNINSCKLRELPTHIVEWMKMDPANNPVDLPPRALILNLSSRLRAFHRGLAAAYMIELRSERTVTGNIKARPDRWARGRRGRKAAEGRIKRK
jgi:hypothetical protein